MSISQGLVNQANVANLVNPATLNNHTLYGAAGAFVAGALVISVGWATSNWWLVILGIVVMVLMAGLSVDLWSHGYQH